MAIKSQTVGPGTLTFGDESTVDWAAQVRSCTVEPDVDKGDPVKVLSGDKITGSRDESFKLSGSILQSFDVDSLLVYCHVNAGTEKKFKYRPNDAQDLGIEGTVIIERVPIGGDVDDDNPESDFEFDGVDMYDLTDDQDDPITEYPAAGGN